MAKRKRLNIVRKSGKPQTDKQLVDSSNEVNHNINEEYEQFGVDTRENLMVASLNHQNYQPQSEQQIQVGSQVESHISFNGMCSSLPKDTILRRKRSSAVRNSSNSQAKEKQILDSSNEVNQHKYSYSKAKEFAQFEAVDTRENLMLASLIRQNDVPQSEQQIYTGSHVEHPISFGRMGESLPEDTIVRRTTRLSARKSGKAQAEEQLINSSNAVNQNNHNINVKYAKIGRGTKNNLMVVSLNNQNDESRSEQQFQVGSLPKDTTGRNIRFKAVQKGGKAHTNEQLIDNSNVGDTREKLVAGSLSHQNHESQPEQQIQVGSHAEYPISFGRMGKSLPKDTMGRCTRLNDVRKIGKSQAEEQLIDSSPVVHQTNYSIHEKSAQLGGVSTRGNLKIASLNHQSDQLQSEQVPVGSHVESPISFGRMNKRLPKDTMGKRRRLNTVRKSGIAQAEEQLIDSSNAVNENSHNINEKSAQLGGEQVQVGSHVESPISFGRMSKRLPKDTMGKHRRLNAVRKSGKAQSEEQLIDSSNAVNQNNHNIYEKSAQLGGVSTSGNLMGASLNHHNVQSQSEQVQVGSHVDSPISFSRTSKRLPKDTMERRKRPNAVQKSGRSQAEKQLINSSIEVNRNHHNINEEYDQFVGDTRENLMAASLTHQSHRSQFQQQVPVENQVETSISLGRVGQRLPKDTTGKRRRLNAVRKSGKAQAEEQLIDSFNAVGQNNHNMHEKSAQLGGVRTRGNLMGASLNHRNDQSQSEHAQVESHVESPISFDRMSKRLPRDTMERRKRPNAVPKSGRSQAEKQLIDSSIEVNRNNHTLNEECDQIVGDTRGNLMVASLNHQSDRSPSVQQIPVESRVETCSVGRMSQSLSKGQTRVRGYTRMLDVWNLPDGEFIRVEVDSLGNPIGWEGKKLLNAIGSLARKHQYAPINILSWKDMPELNITNMLDLIQSKFHFVPTLTDQTKQILKDNLSSKWRQFKHDLKEKGYDENKTEEEMAANIPDRRVDPSQYRALVHHWCSQKGQKISNINKRNRSKYEDIHCMGTKSLPRFIHEATEANGAQPSRAEIYIQTRTRKDGSIVTEKAADVIGELKKHMVEASSSRTPQIPQDSTNWANDIYSKVRGPEKRGSVRCLGKVPRLSNTLSRNPNVENRVVKLENLLGNLVSVLQTRFSADKQINDVLQAIAQEVPAAAPSTPDDSSGNYQQTTSDSYSSDSY
ncbi:uncharacterized protein LOC131643261 isoform X3 [Vicia villosa]|uniref:uncharacterized protein LOC131643261 isoform X3 n=1 Tax=Vicia villosa TaxID=3911 RepID=UPI00273AE1ED|nr:uncharacterized protein LOC131643261 isoform X3 [Vicia villosa]